MPTVRESSQPSSSDDSRVWPGQVLRGDLIDGDAVLDVGAGGLPRVDAGQVRRGGARVIAGAVAERVAVLVREPGEDQRVFTERLRAA